MSNHNFDNTPSLWQESAAIALLLTATLKIMANATISPALPALEARFAAEAGAAYLTRFLTAAPSLSVVLVAPVTGILCDRIGRVPILVAGVLLFAASGSAGAWLPDLRAILASRLVLGVAVAMTMTAQVALVGDLFEGARRNAFIGFQTAAINFSGLVYIGVAGVLAGASARLPFLVYALPLLLVPLLLNLDSHERNAAIDPARVDFDPALTGGRGWLLASVLVGGLTMTTVMLFFLMPSQLPFYLEGNGLDGARGTAVGLGALTVTGGILALSFRWISRQLGLGATLAAGFGSMAAGFGVLAGAPVWSYIVTGSGLVGAGYALVQPALLLLALELAPQTRRGSVGGIVTTAVFLGQVASPLVFTPVIGVIGFAGVYTAAALLLLLLGAGAAVSLVWQRSGTREK